MLNIERLNMNLPAAYADQAHNIANQVAQVLAGIDHSGMINQKSVVVPTIQIAQGASVDILVTKIVTAIQSSLGEY